MTNSITSERLRRGVARFHKGFPDEAKAYANVGRNHPDYGLSPKDHEAMKLARAQGWGAPQSFTSVAARLMDIGDAYELTDQPLQTALDDFNEANSEFYGAVEEPITEKAKTLEGEHGVEFFVPGSNGTVDMSEEFALTQALFVDVEDSNDE